MTEEERNLRTQRIERSARFQRTFEGEGKLVLDEIDRIAFYKANTFHPDPYQHAYNAGQRSIAVFIHTCIEQDIEKERKLLGDKDAKRV